MNLDELHDWYHKYVASDEAGRREMAEEGHASKLDDMFEQWTNEELGALAFEVLSLLLMHRDDPVQTLQVMQAVQVLARHKRTTEFLIKLVEKGSN